MKRKILFSVLGVVAFAIAIMLNVQSMKNNEAKAQYEPSISCRCQWFGDDCKANGWGQRCNLSDRCSGGDSNCG